MAVDGIAPMSPGYGRRKFLKMGAALGCVLALGSDRRAWDARASSSVRGKRVYIMTDMEGVAGVLDSENWCKPDGRNYGAGKELLTAEVNAAIEGFARGGATEFLVADGHGHGGINPKRLDPRARLVREWGPRPYPFGLEEGFDYAAWIGQHAMSRSEEAHLPHTGSFGVFETTINGRPVGEFGQVALCAAQLGVRVIFGSGDLAFTKEAAALIRGIHTVSVKTGTTRGRGDECDRDAYAIRNLDAVHSPPARACEMILAEAEKAIQHANISAGFGTMPIKPPFERVTILRPSGNLGKRIGKTSHPTDAIALMNAPIKYEALNISGKP